jgi:hypothetical protein
MPNVTETATQTANTFQVIAQNTPLLTRRRTDDPDKKQTLSGGVSRLSDGRLMARWTTTSEVGTPLYSYAPFDPDRKQVIGGFGTAVDYAADFKMKRQHLERKHGLHTLPHQPPPGEVDRFLDQWPEVGAKLKLQRTVAPPFLFNPGRVQFPKAGFLDARAWFNRHVQGDFGANGQYDGIHLEPEQIWLIGMPGTPAAVRYRAAIQEGVGIIESRYADSQPNAFVHVLTLLAGDRTETLIFSDFQYSH